MGLPLVLPVCWLLQGLGTSPRTPAALRLRLHASIHALHESVVADHVGPAFKPGLRFGRFELRSTPIRLRVKSCR